MRTINAREITCMKCPQNKIMRKTGKFSTETNVDSCKWLSEEINIVDICDTTISSFSNHEIASITSGNNIVSILLTDDEKMSELNKLYRNKAGTTNVLSLRLIVLDLTIDSVKYFIIPIGGISDLI